MDFSSFCGICFSTENELKENRNGLNILISFLGNHKIINKSKVYLCHRCCEHLEHYDSFRNMCITNVLHFRYLYFELERTLEIGNDPDIKKKLTSFVGAKVYSKCEVINKSCASSRNDVCNVLTAHRVSESDGQINYLNNEDDDVFDSVKVEQRQSQHYTGTDGEQDKFIELHNEIKDMECEDDCKEYKLHSEIDMNSSVLVSLPLTTSPRYTSAHNYIEANDNQCLSTVQSNEDSNEPSPTNETTHIERIVPRGTALNENKEKRKTVVYTCAGNCKKSANSSDKLCVQHSTQQHLIMAPGRNLHSANKAYTCSLCNKTFGRLWQYRAHARVHTGEKPYKCHVCEKAFAHLSTFNRHERVHTGHKPYKCGVCGRAFTQRSNYKRHEPVHNGDKPYKCDLCKKAFATSDRLHIHARHHSGELPYACRMCNKSFSRSSTLRNHERSHSTDMPYTLVL